MAKGMTTNVSRAFAMKHASHSCRVGMVNVQYEAGTSGLQALLLAASTEDCCTHALESRLLTYPIYLWRHTLVDGKVFSRMSCESMGAGITLQGQDKQILWWLQRACSN